MLYRFISILYEVLPTLFWFKSPNFLYPLKHFWVLQEDVPDEFATLVLNFISRNRIGPHGVEVSVYKLLSFLVVRILWFMIRIILLNFTLVWFESIGQTTLNESVWIILQSCDSQFRYSSCYLVVFQSHFLLQINFPMNFSKVLILKDCTTNSLPLLYTGEIYNTLQ